MKALIRVLLRCCTTRAVNPNSLVIVHSRPEYPVNGGAQIRVEFTRDRTTDVISQIQRPDKQDIDTGHLYNLLDLRLSMSIQSKSILGLLMADIHSQEPPWSQSEQS